MLYSVLEYVLMNCFLWGLWCPFIGILLVSADFDYLQEICFFYFLDSDIYYTGCIFYSDELCLLCSATYLGKIHHKHCIWQIINKLFLFHIKLWLHIYVYKTGNNASCATTSDYLVEKSLVIFNIDILQE